MEHTFRAQQPQRVVVSLEAGDLRVLATPTDQVRVRVEGPRSDEVTVEQRGDEVRVIGPRHSGFRVGGDRIDVEVTTPEGSHLATKLGSASVVGRGPLGSVQVATGSGDVALDQVGDPASVKTGSGSITVGEVQGSAHLRTGSGRISVESVDGTAQLSTGSGDIDVRRSGGRVSLKSGSGDLAVAEARGDAVLATASGDLTIGRLSQGQARLKNVSGDIRLGIPEGTPLWTDISTGTGSVRSDLVPVGAPDEGQDHLEVRARTVTGDILLERR